MVDLYDPL